MSEAQGLTPENITTLMPQLKDNLGRLVTIPSVSSPGFPEETRSVLLEAHQAIVGLLREGGVERFSTLDLPDTAPVITGEIPAPDGAPTVLLYGHYDVVGAGDESKVRHAGLEPQLQFVRGGTDGSRLSERGLPTPNIFTGGHDFHSCHEWICVADVRAAVATIVHLAQVWAEETTKGEKRLDASHRHPHPF
jgi:acetylornithine deacetylase/succinyl-diaminopimelate desuccinylase-like protein